MHLFSTDQKIKNKKILITGASGFIGSNLATRLSELGAHVFATSRVQRAGNKKKFTWLKCSFENLLETQAILEKVKPEIIYHLSGEVTASNDSKYVLPTFHSLVTSTVNILAEAMKIGCERIVLTGSCTEPNELELPPGSPYAAAKFVTHTYGKMFWQCYQTPVVIVRPFVGYGPGQSSEKLIPHVISSFLKNESPRLSSGKWESDYIYIDDIVEGMITSVTTPGIEGLTLDLGTGISTSVQEVVLLIKEIIGSSIAPAFGALPDRDNEFVRIADIQETLLKLNWKATTDLKTGLRKTVEAYKTKRSIL